nr:hypothetical protein [Tanacetum cinerariifolium]
MSVAAIEQLITQRVADVLLTYEANQNNKNRNGNKNDNGNGSYDSGDGSRRSLHTARGCTYKVFLNCQPLNFKGTEEAVKYATCTLLGGALTWWNSNVRTIGHEAAYEMTWKSLMKMMTKAYYSRKLALLCLRMVPEEFVKVEKYVGGLPDNIQGNVMTSRLKMLQEVIELANSLMGHKVHAYVSRQADNKRRMYNNPKDNHVQQSPYKRQNVARAYIDRPSEKKEYAETLLLRNKYKLHHNGSCTVKYAYCEKVGRMTRDCRGPTAAADQRTLTCFECENQRHYRSERPRLKNQNYGNQTINGEAHGRVYTLGGGESDEDPNNITDDIDA